MVNTAIECLRNNIICSSSCTELLGCCCKRSNQQQSCFLSRLPACSFAIHETTIRCYGFHCYWKSLLFFDNTLMFQIWVELYFVLWCFHYTSWHHSCWRFACLQTWNGCMPLIAILPILEVNFGSHFLSCQTQVYYFSFVCRHLNFMKRCFLYGIHTLHISKSLLMRLMPSLKHIHQWPFSSK